MDRTCPHRGDIVDALAATALALPPQHVHSPLVSTTRTRVDAALSLMQAAYECARAASLEADGGRGGDDDEAMTDGGEPGLGEGAGDADRAIARDVAEQWAPRIASLFNSEAQSLESVAALLAAWLEDQRDTDGASMGAVQGGDDLELP